MTPHDDTLLASDLAKRLCDAMADIHRRGWCDGTGGNFSCVLNHEPLVLLMAPSGIDKGSVQAHDLIQVDGQGQVLQGNGKASAETRLHITIVETTGAGAVLHTHSQSATLLSRHAMALQAHGQQQPVGGNQEERVASQLLIGGLEMLKGLGGINSHEEEIALPVLANDQNLEQLSQRARLHLLHAPHGLLICGHGLYAWGKDLKEARRHLEILEFLLEQFWRQLLLEAVTGTAALP